MNRIIPPRSFRDQVRSTGSGSLEPTNIIDAQAVITPSTLKTKTLPVPVSIPTLDVTLTPASPTSVEQNIPKPVRRVRKMGRPREKRTFFPNGEMGRNAVLNTLAMAIEGNVFEERVKRKLDAIFTYLLEKDITQAEVFFQESAIGGLQEMKKYFESISFSNELRLKMKNEGEGAAIATDESFAKSLEENYRNKILKLVTEYISKLEDIQENKIAAEGKRLRGLATPPKIAISPETLENYNRWKNNPEQIYPQSAPQMLDKPEEDKFNDPRKSSNERRPKPIPRSFVDTVGVSLPGREKARETGLQRLRREQAVSSEQSKPDRKKWNEDARLALGGAGEDNARVNPIVYTLDEDTRKFVDKNGEPIQDTSHRSTDWRVDTALNLVPERPREKVKAGRLIQSVPNVRVKSPDSVLNKIEEETERTRDESVPIKSIESIDDLINFLISKK